MDRLGVGGGRGTAYSTPGYFAGKKLVIRVLCLSIVTIGLDGGRCAMAEAPGIAAGRAKSADSVESAVPAVPKR